MFLVEEKMGAAAAVDEDDELLLVFWRLGGGAVAALLVPGLFPVSLVAMARLRGFLSLSFEAFDNFACLVLENVLHKKYGRFTQRTTHQAPEDQQQFVVLYRGADLFDDQKPQSCPGGGLEGTHLS